MGNEASDLFTIFAPEVPANLPDPYEDEQPRHGEFLIVGPESPLIWRQGAERIADFFKMERHLCGKFYAADEAEKHPDRKKDRVLVFNIPTDELLIFVGAVGVRWREWLDHSPGWVIEWAWVHPYRRGERELPRAWPLIVEKFSEPYVAEPLSGAMKAFLKKVNYSKLLPPC